MVSFLLLLLFLVATSIFGFTVSRFILGEKRLFALVPFSVLIGINSFNFFTNIVSYTIPIAQSVWIVLATLLLIALLLSLANSKNNGRSDELWIRTFDQKKNRILFGIAIAISLLSGVVAVKSLSLDDLFIGHIPLAGTIVEGNFPVVDPSAPHHRLSYHYSADLLSASLEIITKIPVWLGYDTQTTLFSGLFFLLLFVLLFDITSRFRESVIGSVLFMYGSGFQWVNFFTEGIPAIWHRFVLHENVPAFWKFLTDVAFPKLNTSFIHTMHNHSTAIGMPILILVLICYYRALYASSKKQSIILSIMGGVLLGYLALNLETYYVIVVLSFFTLLVAYVLNTQWNKVGAALSLVTRPYFLFSTLTILLLGLSIGFLQGGILAAMIVDPDRDSLMLVHGLRDFFTLNFAPNPAMLDNSSTYIYVFSFEFFKQFGLSLLLIIPACIHFWKRKEGTFLHLFIIGLGAFLIPFLFRLPTRPWEVSRFFVLGMPMFSLLVGVFLSRLYDKYRERGMNYKKIIVVVAIVLVPLTGLISQKMFAISNLDRFGEVRLKIARPPEASLIDARAYEWIRSKTTLKDYFFPYDADFIRLTRRFTPGVYPYFTFSKRSQEKELYSRMVQTCDPEAFHSLDITYLYVSPQFPVQDWKNCLQKLDAKKVYEDGDDNGFRAIYKIK